MLNRIASEAKMHPSEEARISRLRKVLTSSGFEIISECVNGRSGVTHEFALVAKCGDELDAFDVFEKVTEREVITCFAKGLDTGVRVHMISVTEVTEETRRLAESYGVKLMSWRRAT